MLCRLSSLFLLLLLSSTAADLQDISVLDDIISYRVVFKPHTAFPSDGAALEKLVSITSSDDEHYQCLLPTILSAAETPVEAYSGPSPADLLQPVYQESVCSFRIESYWVYELCHGRYILQYHEEKDTKSRTEYYLGNFVKSLAEAEDKNFNQLSPPRRKFDEEELPYYSVTYHHGTTCDLTGKPRQTIVHYVCDENAKNHIRSLSELSTCSYEMVVMTNRLCAHPSFKKAPPKEHEIQCYADKDQPNEKPRSLLAAEKEATSEFFREFSSQPKPTPNLRQPKNLQTLEALDDQLGDLTMLLDALKTASANAKKQQATSPKAKVLDQQLADDFWSGKTCLYGGSGWWQYEFCYGRKVIQFHEGRGEKRSEITLGVYDKQVHKKWAEQYPHKVLKTDGERVYQVSNLYTQGDVCQETGAHRSCEVRIRCRELSDGGSYSKILIYMLEPETCSYILVVESALFCERLQHVDKQYGLLAEMPGPLVEDFPGASDALREGAEHRQGTLREKTDDDEQDEDDEEYEEDESSDAGHKEL